MFSKLKKILPLFSINSQSLKISKSEKGKKKEEKRKKGLVVGN
jgi:hypothetical protein